MSAAAPNPNNMMMLAVIGIGAYWLMSRNAHAQRVTGARQGASGGNTAGILGSIAGALSRLSGGSSGQRNPVFPDGLTNDMPTTRDDGVVVNNPYTSAFDWWSANGTGGD